MNEKTEIILGNVTCKIKNAPKYIHGKISTELSVKAPNYWFSPSYKSGMWDGNFRFYQRPANTFPTGLINKVIKILKENNIEYFITDTRHNINKYKLKEIPQNYNISEHKIARDYQVQSINNIIKNNIDGLQFNRGIINIATNGGKAQPLWANIVTDKGFTPMGDLKIGDYVYGEDGQKHKILNIFEHKSKSMYKVTLNDGTSTVCCDEHLWAVQNDTDRLKNKYRVLELKELTKNLYYGIKDPRPNWTIPVASPVNFPYKSIKIDPWLLGFLIGDGIISNGSIGFSNSEKDVIQRATKLIEELGDKVKQYKNSNYCDFAIIGNNLRTLLREYGLYGCNSYNKFIPKDYLINTVEVRLKLLHGLNDSDGYVDKSKSGYVEYSTASKQLSEDLKFLIQSLSGSVHITEKVGSYTTKIGEKLETKLQYVIGERFFDLSITPVSSEKHLKKWIPRKKGLYKYIVSVDYLGEEPARCIYVDNPTHLYLTDDFIVTHNTSIAIALIKELYPKLKKHNEVFLFVTHSKEIAIQAKSSIETDLGISVGFIGDGAWELDNVTVCLISTLNRRTKKPEFKELIPRVIGFVADECHHSSATTWYDTFNLLENASIRIGLTGTVEQKNLVNEMRIYACTGDILSKISNDFLIKEGYSAKPICVLTYINKPRLNVKNYQEVYRLGIINNNFRLEIIKGICKIECKHNNTILILVEFVEHGELLLNNLNLPNKRIEFMHGALSTDTRANILKDLKDNYIDILISTSVLDEGVDVSNINSIIYARGGMSTRKLLQGIGRGLRKKADNSTVRVYDFLDNTNKYLLKHSSERLNTLVKENFELIVTNSEKSENISEVLDKIGKILEGDLSD